MYTRFNERVYEGEAELSRIWTPVITPLGSCFAFATKESVYVPGTSAGLTVHAWLNQSSYPDAAAWAGVHVLISPNGNNANDATISSTSSGTVIVPPGAVSFVGTSMHEMHREEDGPWSNCVPAGADGYGARTVEQCKVECIMNATREHCGCRLIGDGMEGSEGYAYCGSGLDECASGAIEDEDLVPCTSCAIPPCKERTYTARHSGGRISQKALDSVAKMTNTSVEEIYSNFVHVQVNYDSIRYEETTETKSTSVWQLLSNLGGSFGFFMGISLISIVELVVELIGLRLLPRLWGEKRLFGIGQKKFD